MIYILSSPLGPAQAQTESNGSDCPTPQPNTIVMVKPELESTPRASDDNNDVVTFPEIIANDDCVYGIAEGSPPPPPSPQPPLCASTVVLGLAAAAAARIKKS